MIKTDCLIMTPALKELHSQFHKMPEKIFKDYVSRWIYEYRKDEKAVPTKKDIINIATKVSDSWTVFIDKDDVKVTNIYAGANQNTILSNFAERPFTFDGITFNSVEQAFQWSKMNYATEETKGRAQQIQEQILNSKTPSTLKRLGGTRGTLTQEALKEWDNNKREVMKSLIKASLEQNPRALVALISTGDSSLTHIQDNSIWKTQFPIILEELREELKDSLKPSFKGKMSFSYNGKKREDITADTTLEAIKRGERIATTRYSTDGNIEYWEKAKVGDIIEFYNNSGESVLVRVTKPLTLLSPETSPEEWSKKEGWSIGHFNSKVKPKIDKGEAYQIEFTLVDNFNPKVLDEANDSSYKNTTDEIQPEPSINESNFHKVDAELTSIKKRQRITLINRLFSQEVEKAQKETIDRLNTELNSTSDISKKLELAFNIKNMRPYLVIKQKTPFYLYDKVKEAFEEYRKVLESNEELAIKKEIEQLKADKKSSMLPEPVLRNLATSYINHYKEAYDQILRNWNELILDAAGTYSSDYGVIINMEKNTIEEEIDETPTNDEGYNRNEETQDGKEETPYKEGWQVDVREISAFERVTNQVRQIIGSIERVDKNGDTIKDDLGYGQTLQQSYVFAEIISSLRDMTEAKQMLPMLEALQSRKPWAKQVVDALKNDDKLFTAFYKVFRKDYLNMWVQTEKEDAEGKITVKTVNINKPTGTAHYFDEWRDNYEYGILFDDDSIYNNNGEIVVANANIGLNLVNGILDKFRGLKTKEENQRVIMDNIDTIHKMLKMIGVSITDSTLSDLLSHEVNFNNKAELPGSIILDNLRTIFRDIPNNKGIEDGKPADIINIYGRALNSIATAINNVEEDEIESSIRQGKKTLYAHTNPSYATTLIKKLRSLDFKGFIEKEYKSVDFLYDKKQGRWLNSLIDDLENESEAREKLNHITVIEHNRKEYDKWTPLETFLVLYNQYLAEPVSGAEGYAWYQIPLLSDSTSAEFIRAKRVRKDYEEVLLDKFADVVRQEYNRIVTVKERSNKSEIEKISSYDTGGLKFQFFPKLNTERFNVVKIGDEYRIKATLIGEELANYTDEMFFFDYLASIREDTDAFNNIAKEGVKTIMDEDFTEALDIWSSIGVFDRVDENNEASSFKYFKQKNRSNIESSLREYYWNSAYMQSQIIQLLTTDLAYYKDYANFTKRALEFHASTEKLNPLAKWNGEYVLASEDSEGNITVRPERMLGLIDEVKTSEYIKDVEDVIDQKIAKGELTAYDKTTILGKWSECTITDAQAFRTLKSYRATQIAGDMWNQDAEDAYNNIRRGTWTAKDFVVLWNTVKPYLYSQINQPDGVGGTMRVPNQHKNSEMTMLTQAIFGAILHKSDKLRALSDFMEEYDIDVAMFNTAIKVGAQGLVNLNDVKTYKEVKNRLEDRVLLKGSKELNPQIIREFSWDDYGFQTATPEHGVDATQLVGSQIRRLIGADISEQAEIKLGDKTLTREQWRDYFNAINTANIRESFESLDKDFSDINKISELLKTEIRSNSRYSNDLIEAVTVVDGQFNIPIFDSTISQKIQELLNSIIKSRIVKQKIAGGALIQATPWFLNDEDKPQIVWGTDENGEKYIKYMEAYIPCPNEKLYGLLVNEDGSLDINKRDENGNFIVPEKYRQVIGYRIPTEDKYSMIPIRVKGYLPRQVGSVIILPEDIVTTTGSDYDVDKIYVMYHTLEFKNVYDNKALLDTFYKSHPEIVNLIEEAKQVNFKRAIDELIKENPDINLEEYSMDDMFKSFIKGHKNYEWVKGVQEEFTYWFEEVKDRFPSKKSVEVVNYKDSDIDLEDSKNRKIALYKQAMKNSKKQRDSRMIELMWSILTNPDTVGKMINPGNFDEQKRDARIVTLLNNLSLDEIERLGGINKLLSLSSVKAEDMLSEYGKIINPLTPNTWIEFQQRNMSGAGLVPVAATQNASHALTQLTGNFGLTPSYRFIFNGKRLGSLHSVKSVDNKFISKNVSSYLAAFVDNAKDPVAGDLNINSTTSNLAFLLLRLGNSPITTSLVLRQPAMMKVMKYVNSGKYSLNQAIEEALEDYKKARVDGSYEGKVIDFNFTDEWLAENIAAEKNGGNIHSKYLSEAKFANNQVKVLVMLKQMTKAAEELGNVVRAIRSDSQSGGPGGSIASGNDKIESVLKILNNSITDPNYPLEGLEFINELAMADTEEKILNSTLPIQTAMFQYGLMSTQKWFKDLFPQVSSEFNSVITEAKKLTTYGNLDSTTINKIYSQLIIYLMTGLSNDFSGDIDSRKYYINDFPIEFSTIKKENPYLVEKLPLVRRLQVLFSNKYNGSPTLVFKNVGKVTNIQSDDYRSDFRYLLSNESTSDIAKKLLVYSFYRGLGFSPSSYSNLIPTQLKMSDITDYVPSLRQIIGLPIDSLGVQNFLTQFIRNNLDDRRLVPEVSSSGIFKSKPTDTFTVTVTRQSSQDMKKFIYPIKGDEEIHYRKFVSYSYKGSKNYYVCTTNDGVYRKITPLGSNQYQEYDFFSDGLSMESAIKESKQKNFNYTEDYRAKVAEESFLNNPEISEQAYVDMPSDIPSINLKDLKDDIERKASAYESRFDFMDRLFSQDGLNSEQEKILDDMDKAFEKLKNIDSVDKDLEGNNKCN